MKSKHVPIYHFRSKTNQSGAQLKKYPISIEPTTYVLNTQIDDETSQMAENLRELARQGQKERGFAKE